MEWHKTKTVLICLFLFVNVYLIYVLIKTNSPDELDRSRLQSVLLKSNIGVDIKIIPENNAEIFVPEFYTPEFNDDFAKIFISNPVKIDELTYSERDSAEKQISFSENKIFFSDNNPSDDFFNNINKKNAEYKLNPYLKKMGIEKNTTIKSIEENNGVYTAVFGYYVNKNILVDSYLKFVLTEKGITEASGYACIPSGKDGYTYRLSKIEAILLGFAKNMDTPKPPIKINSIKLCFYIQNYNESVTVQAIPVYFIETDDKQYIYDARDGVDPSEISLR